MKSTSPYLLLLLSLLSGCNGREETKYYPNGSVKSKIHLDADGLYTGYGFNYSQEGNLVSKVPFTHGEVNGKLYIYYSNGKMHSQETLINDKQNGLGLYFYNNGILKARKKYIAGVVVDTSYHYYQDGKLQGRVLHSAQGKIIDFDFYNKDGRRDILYTRPLTITDADTINNNKEYTFEVVLANRLSNAIIVKIASPGNRIDSLRSQKEKYLYKIASPRPGLNVIRGRLYNKVLQHDTLFTYHFDYEHKFFVRNHTK